MAFAGAEADIVADRDGRRRAARRRARRARSSDGLRPKFVYTIPEYQNPTGRTLPLERRRALVELCRRHGVLIFEDVAYRELVVRRRRRCRRCGRWRRTSCCRRARSRRPSSPACGSAGPPARPTSSPSSPPPSRTPTSAPAASGSGWWRSTAAPAASSATSRRPGRCTRRTGRRCRRRCERHMPDGRRLDRADGRLPHLADAARRTRHARPAPGRRIAAGVAYVPGPPFHAGDRGRNAMRLSFSHLTETELETAAERLAGVVAGANSGS